MSAGATLRVLSLTAAAALLVIGVSAQERVNPNAAALAEYAEQVKAYMTLHGKEASQLQGVKQGKTPAEVQNFEKALAARIVAARPNAKQGDIMVAAVVPVFKQIFADYYKRRSGREIRLLFDEVPNFKPQVNVIYPVNSPKANFPPRLSLALPTLPEPLDYRLVATNLVLCDSEANLVIDYITDVLPPSSKPRTAATP